MSSDVCVMTDIYSCLLKCIAVCVWARKQFISVTVLKPLVVQCSPPGSLLTELQEGKEPKTITNATTECSYLPYFLWRKEIYFTSWWATRERTRARGWVGWTGGRAGRICWSMWSPAGRQETRKWPRSKISCLLDSYFCVFFSFSETHILLSPVV